MASSESETISKGFRNVLGKILFDKRLHRPTIRKLESDLSHRIIDRYIEYFRSWLSNDISGVHISAYAPAH